MQKRLYFSCDYLEGAHPSVLQRLAETNLEKAPGYGLDRWCASAREKIRTACRAPEAEVFFLVGGTQTNAVVIGGFLKSYQGVVTPESGHINTHEAGAIELGGHKVLPLPQKNGKLSAADLAALLEDYESDGNRDHLVMPGLVCLAQPTECGTLYSRAELQAISAVCRAHSIPLYVDGARLAYALACPENDVSLADLADLCDAFYIGGTKCGALLGEAVVFPKPNTVPHFFTVIKQRGALLAKGRLLGLQFDALFTDKLYQRIGAPAIQAADRIRAALRQGGIPLCFDSPTNQVFCVVENEWMKRLARRVEFSFWEKYDETHTVIRFAASWAVDAEEVDALCRLLSGEAD